MSHPPTNGARRLALAPEPDRAVGETARAIPEPARETDRATLRATARHLSDQAISNREIGRQLGISKDKVKRLLDELAAEEAADASHDEPDQPRAETARATPEPAAEPAPDADPEIVPGHREEYLRLTLTPQMREHLAVLAEAGQSAEEAVANCLGLVAVTVASIWDRGLLPRGILPRMRIQSYPPPPAPGSPTQKGGPVT